MYSPQSASAQRQEHTSRACFARRSLKFQPTAFAWASQWPLQLCRTMMLMAPAFYALSKVGLMTASSSRRDQAHHTGRQMSVSGTCARSPVTQCSPTVFEVCVPCCLSKALRIIRLLCELTCGVCLCRTLPSSSQGGFRCPSPRRVLGHAAACGRAWWACYPCPGACTRSFEQHRARRSCSVPQHPIRCGWGSEVLSQRLFQTNLH